MSNKSKFHFITKYLILYFFFINVIGCNNTQNKSTSESQNLSFTIDYNLLNPIPLKNDQGFSIYVPIGWSDIDSTKINQLRGALESKENIIRLEMIGAYQSKDLATCIVSKVDSKEINFQYIPEDYIELLKSQFFTENINTANIIINNLDVRQFLITNDTHISFILFITGEFNYQVNYIIPKELYAAELSKIESSIGTIMNKGEQP